MKERHTEAAAELSDILVRKTEGRREIARRSFGQKIAMMEALRERLAPFKRARQQRQATRLTQADSRRSSSTVAAE